MSSRLLRGFHRLGVVLASPAMMGAAWIAARETWLQWQDRRELASGADPVLAKLLADPEPFPHVPVYDGAAMLLGIGLGIYAAARAVGWVLDGFLTPGHDP